MIRLYVHPDCPFVHRPRALLKRFDAEYESIEIDLDDRPDAFLSLTPTGKVPLLVEGELVLYESRIVDAYLAERFEWSRAWPDDPAARARHRLAIEQWDAVVLPAWYASLKADGPIPDENREAVEDELDELERTVRRWSDGEVDTLLGFHCATHWTRIRALAGHSEVHDRIRDRSGTAAWLDRAADLEPVRATAPSEDEIRTTYFERYVGRAKAATT